MKSTLLKIVIAVMALLGTAYGVLWFSPPPAKPALTAAPTDHSIQIGSVERTYTTYLPADLPRNAPLLVMVHGTSMDGRMIRRWTGYAFDELADEGQFAVAYPEVIGGTWNECRHDGPTPAKRENVDDLGFLRGMVAAMTRDHGIDPAKVYFVGYSNGAQMVFRMLADAPDITAGTAVAGAGYPTADSHLCQTTWPARPVMIATGFVINGFYEDYRPDGDGNPIRHFMPNYFVVRAEKQGQL